jgi:hypothetical protein
MSHDYSYLSSITLPEEHGTSTAKNMGWLSEKIILLYS